MSTRLFLAALLAVSMVAMASAERVDLGTIGTDVEVTVIESDDFHTVVRFEVGVFHQEAVIIQGDTYYEIFCGKEGILLNEGEPALPRLCRSIIIPDDARMEIKVLASEYYDFPTTPVAPSKGNLMRTVNPEDVPYTFGAVYQGTDWYPTELATIREPFILRDYRGTVIELNAFRYNPGEQVLRVYTSVTVEVLSVGPGEINVYPERQGPVRLVSDFEVIYECRFINYGLVKSRYDLIGQIGDLLIITYDDFHTTMNPFVEWKRQKGIKTTIVDVSSIGNNPTSIDNFIQDFYDTTDMAYVLLVGDAAQVTSISASGGSSDPTYVKLVGTADYPDAFIGRFSAENVSQCQTQVERTITYERDHPGTGWFHKGTGIGSSGGPGHHGEYDWQHTDLIRDSLLSFTYTLVDQLNEPDGVTSADVANALNDGRSIVNYTGHGGPTSWSTSGFSNSNVNALVNDNMLPFMVSVACNNGEFDIYTCFGEAWLRATNGGVPTGAIGAYMSSIGQSWNPPMDAQDEVVHLLINEVVTSYGALCFNGSCKMIDINGAGGVSMCDTWHIFGDPSLQVRTATPGVMVVDHDGTVFFQNPTYQVIVPGVQGALCALYHNGIIYGSAYTDTSCQAIIPIVEPLPIGVSVTLTVTAFNKQTIIEGVQVTSDLAIVHTPLPDTKDTLNDYEVLCQIYSDSALVADSCQLWYNVGSGWNSVVLTYIPPNEDYVAYIPTQSPGTVINYYLYAENIVGNKDTTDVFTFRVIDYQMILDPTFLTQTVPSQDTGWYDLSVTNDGVLPDDYNFGLTSVWNTSVWDASGTTQISSTGTLMPTDVFDFKVRVLVPVSVFGERDSATLVVSSSGDPSITATASIVTVSAGEPLSLPFFEDFASTDIDTVKWESADGVVINDVGLGEPSPPYSANFDGSPSGGDMLVSQEIDLSGRAGVTISYTWQRRGGGESPDAGDDLIIEYMNNVGAWTLLNQHLGSGTDMSAFETYSTGVPPDGYHSLFQLRFRNLASTGLFDDWFVDDIRIDYGASISATPLSFDVYLIQGDSTEEPLIIANGGPGSLSYNIAVSPVFTRPPIFATLFEWGQVNPARYDYEDGWLPADLPKSFTDPFRGPEVVYNAGGPDNFGYIWVDSDEPGGPVFNWIDIVATGTDITAGLTDDNFVGPFPIGFSFSYYDQFYTEFYVGSNGLIGFGPTASYGSLSNTAMPSVGTPDNFIAWCWDDLNITHTGTNGKVLSEVVGGELVIEFYVYPEYESGGAGDAITAEIILSPDGDIRLQYLVIDAGFDKLGCTIGIENIDGTDGLQIVHNAAYLHDSLAVQITKPAQWLYLSSTSGDLLANEADTIPVKFNAAEIDTGVHQVNIIINSNDPDSVDNPLVIPAQLTVGTEPQFIYGDANGDGEINVADVVYLIDYIFAGGPAPDPLLSGDCDCNNLVNIADVVYLIGYIFGGGPPPCIPPVL
ncbi:MAG: hypothetical protein KAT58_08160 [candidate division Zixibacteria bacterium]|nr:hypothetical protein [candidate division Zixibacteria bacterium]